MSVQARRVLACHWLLLRLAGRSTDDLLTQCRRWLSQRRVLDVGRAVTYAVLSQRIRLANEDIDLLAELLAADGVDTSSLAMVDVADTDPMPMCGFAPTRKLADANSTIAADTQPRALMTESPPEDETDRAVLAAARGYPAARALWRAWRFPGAGAPWPPRRRVWVVETDPGCDLAGLTGMLQEIAERSGEVHPQLEVYPMGEELPSYQRLARDFGGLMWSRSPDPGVRVARMPASAWAREVRTPAMTDAELAAVLRYLRDAVPVHLTATQTDDVVRPDRRGTVPLTVRTDGFWIWCEASAYYLARYGIRPDPDLLAHIRSRGYDLPIVDGASLYRALAVFQRLPPFTRDG